MHSFDLTLHLERLARQLLARNELVGSLFSHGDILGGEAEAIVRDFLSAVFPDLGVVTGQVIATNGEMSPQCDVILYDRIPGAALGKAESGAVLVRLEAVRAVFEVKRSVNRQTVAKMQQYAKRLAEAFVAGQRQGRWLQYGFAFASSQTSDRVLGELNRHWHREDSVGGLLVLDLAPSASELKSLYGSCGDMSRKGQPTGTTLRSFLSAARLRPGGFYVRGAGSYTKDSGSSPLRSFVTNIEGFLASCPRARTALRSTDF